MKKNDGRLLVVVCSFRSWRPVIEGSLLKRRARVGVYAKRRAPYPEKAPSITFLVPFLFQLLCAHHTLISSLAPSD